LDLVTNRDNAAGKLVTQCERRSLPGQDMWFVTDRNRALAKLGDVTPTDTATGDHNLDVEIAER
jgi:hypothetical protein